MHALDHGESALSSFARGTQLILEDDRAVRRDGQVLEVRVVGRGRPGRQNCRAKDAARVAVEKRDVGRPGENDVPVRQEIEVLDRDPVAGDVDVVEIGAPDLAPRGRIRLGDERPRRDCAGDLRQIAAGEVQFVRLAAVDERDGLIAVEAAPGVDLV